MEVADYAGGDGYSVAGDWTQGQWDAYNTERRAAAIYRAYMTACSHSVDGCKPGQKVRVRYVGFTYNVQVRGDLLSVGSVRGGISEIGVFAGIFHKGSNGSFYLTSAIGLLGANVPHVVNLPTGVEAHIDHFGPANPLHWIEGALSLFVNTRAEAGAGVLETCSPIGGCR